MESPPHRRLQVRAPWAEPTSRFPALFERWSIQGMQQTGTGNRGRAPRDPPGARQKAFPGAGGGPGPARHAATSASPDGVQDEDAVGPGQEYATLAHNLEKATGEGVNEGQVERNGRPVRVGAHVLHHPLADLPSHAEPIDPVVVGPLGPVLELPGNAAGERNGLVMSRMNPTQVAIPSRRNARSGAHHRGGSTLSGHHGHLPGVKPTETREPAHVNRGSEGCANGTDAD